MRSLDFRRQPIANGKMPVSSLAFCSLAIRTQQVAGWVSGSYCSCRVLVGESAALTSRYLMPSTADITHACSCPDFSSPIVVPAWLLLSSSDRNDDRCGPSVARNDAAILDQMRPSQHLLATLPHHAASGFTLTTRVYTHPLPFLRLIYRFCFYECYAIMMHTTNYSYCHLLCG